MNKQYLVLVDSFSNFTDVHELSSLSSQQVIQNLYKTFRYYGLPDEIVCDNGKQFLSNEFRDFLKNNTIELLLSPPYHSQSNGKAERAIRSLKMFLNKNQPNNNIQHLISQFCMVHNFFPNCNGTIPCREYLVISPRILMRKILVSDKRGVTEGSAPQVNCGSSVIPLADNRVAHSGGIIPLQKRIRIPNSKYYNDDFMV
jgi:transposase InsO family protein